MNYYNIKSIKFSLQILIVQTKISRPESIIYLFIHYANKFIFLDFYIQKTKQM